MNAPGGAEEVAMERKSNYDAVRETWRQRFLQMDAEVLAERFSLKIDCERLYLTYFSHPYAIDRATGEITRLDCPGWEVGFDEAMCFYNMFHYAQPHPVASGELVPFRSVKRVYPFESAYRRSILDPLCEYFTGHVPQLKRALEVLHAQPMRQGDASGRLDVFPGLQVAVLFWDGDDEFPAQANMLFDSNITDFMHEENVVLVASDALRFLQEAAGERW